MMTNRHHVSHKCMQLADIMEDHWVTSVSVNAQVAETAIDLDVDLEYPSDSNSGNQNYLNIAKKRGKGKR